MVKGGVEREIETLRAWNRAEMRRESLTGDRREMGRELEKSGSGREHKGKTKKSWEGL